MSDLDDTLGGYYDGRDDREAEDDYDYEDDGEANCFHCDGDGWVECPNPLECTRHHRGGLCRCSSCGGSGLAKDMTIW